MIRKIKVLNLYSEYNIDIDIVVVVHREEQVQQAEEIMDSAHLGWFLLVENKNGTTFCDYLESHLKKAHIGYDLYERIGSNLWR